MGEMNENVEHDALSHAGLNRTSTPTVRVEYIVNIEDIEVGQWYVSASFTYAYLPSGHFVLFSSSQSGKTLHRPNFPSHSLLPPL
jgi:hypothetical protein